MAADTSRVSPDIDLKAVSFPGLLYATSELIIIAADMQCQSIIGKLQRR